MDFNVGDRVLDADHGPGTVGWIGTEYIGVEFDSRGKVLLKREGLTLRHTSQEDEGAVLTHAATEPESDTTVPPEPFFVFEGPDAQHFLGSHWDPFFEDVQEVVEGLPAILRVARHHGGYAQSYPPPTTAAVRWIPAQLLLASSEAMAESMGFERRAHKWDDLTTWRSPGGALPATIETAQEASERESGIAAVIRLADSPGESNVFCSAFPYYLHGAQHTLTLEQVRIWIAGVEAQLRAKLGECPIHFYDMDFVNNRDWYRRGANYEFLLVGIAYNACIAETQTFTIQRSPEYVESMAWLMGEEQYSEPGPLEEHYTTRGLAALLPVDGWDVDDYSFRGPVKTVWGMSMLGRRAWRVRVTVLRCSGFASEDIDLDIIVSERAWTGDSPPREGDEIEGRMWLQGRLWSVSSEPQH